MVPELEKIMNEIEQMPEEQIKEPFIEVENHHHVVGCIKDTDLKRLYTGYYKKVRELDSMHRVIKGPMLVARNIPEQIQAKMVQLQEEMDLLRNMFFYVVAARFQIFGKKFVNVHRGWLVSWSNQNQQNSDQPDNGQAGNQGNPN